MLWLMRPIDPLSVALAAIAHPIRRELLRRLSFGPIHVSFLIRGFRISIQAVARHIQVLESAELIFCDRYRVFELRSGALKSVETWMERYRGYFGTKGSKLAGDQRTIADVLSEHDV